MEMLDLNYVVTMCVLKQKKIEEVVTFTTYIPVQEKLIAIDEYLRSLKSSIDGKNAVDSFEQYFKFTMLAVKMYTNIKIEGTYEEYDILIKNGFLKDILGCVQEDYSDFHSLMKMKLNDYMRNLI